MTKRHTMEERKKKMTNNNQPEEHNHLEHMLARYNVTPENQQAPTPAALNDGQPTSRREAKSRQNNNQHDDMEDQSFWDRAKQYILPAVLVLCILLSLFTRLF